MPYTYDSHKYDELLNNFPNAKRILAEGDSWFAYPDQFFAADQSANIIENLAKEKNIDGNYKYVIYNTATNGAEAVSMLSGKSKHNLMKRLQANYYDFMLFSGGGNDIVGQNDFDFLLKEKEANMTALDCINTNRLNNKLDQIASIYVELIERVLEFSQKQNKNIKILTHTYDFAIPNPKAYELFNIIPLGMKSWMYPALIDKGIRDTNDQKLISRTILTKFKERLLAIQEQYSENFYVVNTQGTLQNENEWLNELHPTPTGFKLIAHKIANVIDSLD